VDGSGRQPCSVERGGLQAVDIDVATAGAVTIERARRCAARKKRGKALGHPGKERQEGEEGVQPSNIVEGTQGAAAAWGRSSECA
jgi:hypothetical protein